MMAEILGKSSRPQESKHVALLLSLGTIATTRASAASPSRIIALDVARRRSKGKER